MRQFTERALQWAITHGMKPSQVRNATNDQIAVAAGATIGDDGFYPQPVRRLVVGALRRRAQAQEWERLRSLLEARLQQEYPRAQVAVGKLEEYGKVLIIHHVPVYEITGDE